MGQKDNFIDSASACESVIYYDNSPSIVKVYETTIG